MKIGSRVKAKLMQRSDSSNAKCLGKRPILDSGLDELEKGLRQRHQVELDDLGEVLKPVFF